METQSDEKEQKGWRLLKQDLKDNMPGVAAVCAYILIFQIVFSTVCPMQLLFGLPCPGCGLTRAGLLLLQGHYRESFRMHPFLAAWIFLAAYWAAVRYLVGKKSKLLIWLVAVVCILMVVFYLYRMYRYFPHTEPMNPLVRGLAGQIISLI